MGYRPTRAHNAAVRAGAREGEEMSDLDSKFWKTPYDDSDLPLLPRYRGRVWGPGGVGELRWSGSSGRQSRAERSRWGSKGWSMRLPRGWARAIVQWLRWIKR